MNHASYVYWHNRIWYLSWYDAINICKRWILAANIQKQQDMSMRQTSSLEFYCVDIYNCNMVILMTNIHTIVNWVLTPLWTRNLHASTLPNFFPFKSDISCCSLSLKTLVTISNQSCAVKLRPKKDRWISGQYGLQVKVKKQIWKSNNATYGHSIKVQLIHILVATNKRWR